MLEQAVYARRNHTAILAGLFLLLLSGSARAADTLELGFESQIEQLITSPAGGAWVQATALDRSRIVTVTPQGRIRSTRATLSGPAALGPDGRAWFGSSRGILRVDAAGTPSTLRSSVSFSALATGPDGTMWLATDPLTRVTPAGAATPMPLSVPDCPAFDPYTLTRAADGAMWFRDLECGLVRLPPGGTPTIVTRAAFASELVPDLHGGVWFTDTSAPGGGHVTVDGHVTPLKAGLDRTQDVAVAPDGTAYYATGRCFLARASADGTLTRVPTAIPAWHVGFDPAGGLWLASLARLQHTTLGAPAAGCDDRAPAIRVTPDPRKPVSLAALRRNGGFTLTVREPFKVESGVFDNDIEDSVAYVNTTVSARRGRTVRVAMSPRLIDKLARRKGTPFSIMAAIRDREGNPGGFEYPLTFRR